MAKPERHRNGTEAGARPLAGIAVVTLEHAIAAPFCTRQLADLGARVIKIERPGVGDFARAYDERVKGLASHFVWTNRSKESMTLDVKHPEGQAILRRLVLDRADVVVQNLAPGAAARLGVSHAALSGDKPELIVCDISGYGSDGPYRAAHATIYPYGPFPTGDGRTVMLGLQNEREWALFCRDVLHQPALATDPRFASNSRRTEARRELRAMVVAEFARLTAEQVVARLDAAQIANARMNEMRDVWGHEQLAARARWTEVATPAGLVPALVPPGQPDAYSPRMDPVPALGEHTDAILEELGCSAAEIARLRACGAI